ncbi:hypothetical protein CN228_08260 [Pseudomonas syringae pv. actinidiae str. Shaanxi_M228]|nr:hypothetical protein CN228_08260 [Pseudomonas syringae pv. actinidiae str. Shaanxi_M228]
MRQYLKGVSGTGNAIDEEPSVGNRYRDDWGLVASAWMVRPSSSSRRGSTFRGDGRSRLRATLLVGSPLRDYDIDTVRCIERGWGSRKTPLLHRKDTRNVV